MKKYTFYFALAAVTSYCTLSVTAYANPSEEPSVPDAPTHLRSQSEPEFEKSKTPEAKTERIHIEDSSTQIDELRVRGETQSIHVKPKNMPAYEVIPINASSDRNNGGKRMWKVLDF